MPFYKDTSFGPSEHVPRRSPPEDEEETDIIEERYYRRSRDVISYGSSPIPASPGLHSYRELDDDEGIEERAIEEEVAHDDAAAVNSRYGRDQMEGLPTPLRSSQRGERKYRLSTPSGTSGARRVVRPPPPPSDDESAEEEEDPQLHRPHTPRDAPEKYWSLPRAPLQSPRRARRGEESQKTVNYAPDGLVSSRPRPSPQEGKKRATSIPHQSVYPSPKHLEDSNNNAARPRAMPSPRPSATRRRGPSSVVKLRRDFHTGEQNPAEEGSVVEEKEDIYVHRRSARKPPPPPSRSSSASSSSSAHRARSRRASLSSLRVGGGRVRAGSPGGTAPEKLRSGANKSSPSATAASPVRCPRCGYVLPEEMEAYLFETSTYKSVPRPHCPACGSRLDPSASTAVASAAQPQEKATKEEAPTRHVRRRRSRHRHRRSSADDNDVDESSDGSIGEGSESSANGSDEERPRRRTDQQQQSPAPPLPLRRVSKSRRDMTEHDVYSDREVNDYADEPYAPHEQPPRFFPPPDLGATAAHHLPASHAPELIVKSPYLTLELMPRSLASTTKKRQQQQQLEHQEARPGSSRRSSNAQSASAHANSPSQRRNVDLSHVGVPWATSGCTACSWQCTSCLAGICCCAMPCVLLRERQQLLFHEVESRYICCAGAFPCCVPPLSLRPELYYTVKTNYHRVPGPQDDAALQEGHRPPYWGDAVEVSGHGSSSSEQSEANAGNGGNQNDANSRRVAALRSVNGVASPASLVNPCTGLPLEGCYRNASASGKRPHTGTPASSGTGCCDCLTCVDNTCVWDCNRGCCLTCAHPTAHCLACPLCCLCCELTCCIPCALWANRLLIRQHYDLAPDPAVDGGSECCYACCLACCTCSDTSVMSLHYKACTQYQPSTVKPSSLSAPSPLSCWSQLATTVAGCLAAVCCLCPCAPCSLAQTRDQMERLGFPLVAEVPPEVEMM